ncbi:hypothetical protein [Ornithinimicrobium kibberense]|uniref:LPXTG-motif cell wall-anchored protein n=2 Tax=Ornithinimicrobium kibberense TaxID=282060 RepID=A0ABV5V2D0_9MICO
MSTTFRRGAGAIAAGLLVAGGGTMAHADSHDNTNQTGYWVTYLEAEGYVDVTCTKVEAGQLSALGTVGQVDTDGDGEPDTQAVTVNDPWLLAVVKAGSTDASVDDENTLWWDVAAGDAIYHKSGKDISHVIGCNGVLPEEPTDEPEQPTDEPEQPTDEPEQPTDEPEQPTDEPEQPGTPGDGDDAGKPIGPIVQTDVPEKGVNPALPLAAVAAAGLGLAGLGLRRRGQEH